VVDACAEAVPDLVALAEGHQTRCIRAEELFQRVEVTA
jgi:hypothetical protein